MSCRANASTVVVARLRGNFFYCPKKIAFFFSLSLFHTLGNIIPASPTHFFFSFFSLSVKLFLSNTPRKQTLADVAGAFWSSPFLPFSLSLFMSHLVFRIFFLARFKKHLSDFRHRNSYSNSSLAGAHTPLDLARAPVAKMGPSKFNFLKKT